MSRFVHSRLFHFLILFVLLLGLTYYSGSSHSTRKQLQYKVFDTFNRLHPRPPTSDIVIVDIDEPSLDRLGQWPWPRTVMADLVTRLKQMGARSITFDMVFAEEDRTSPVHIAERLPDQDDMRSVRQALAGLPDNDDVLARAIADAGNVVMGFTNSSEGGHYRVPVATKPIRFLPKNNEEAIRNLFVAESYWSPYIAASLDGLSRAAAGNAHFSAAPDVDGIIRQLPLLQSFSGRVDGKAEQGPYPVLGLEALRVAVDPRMFNQIVLRPERENTVFSSEYKLRIAERYDVPVDPHSRFWMHYREIDKNEYLSAYKVFSDEFAEEVGSRIRNKIVFIGTSSIGLKDIRSSPLNLSIPGVEMHVNMVEQILQQRFLQRPAVVAGAEFMAILVVGLLIIVSAPFVNAVLMGVVCLLLILGGFSLSWHAYTEWGLLLDPAYPGLSVTLIFLVSTLLSYIRTEADRRQVRNAFGHYISPDFMRELTENPDKLVLGGETRDLTVMFTDIRNFTSLSERLSPAELIQLMNDFLTPMSDLVMENRGTIDKFMGDAMMAFWNAPLDDPEHARHACLTALHMNEALKPINERLRKEAEDGGRLPLLLQAGIGINSGPASVGNMGSRHRFAYSALGDNVNLASRLEGQTKFYGVDNLIGAATQAQVPDLATLELDLLRVKGKNEPVRIYTLLGDAALVQAAGFQSWKKTHEEMLALYRLQEFSRAEDAVVQCLNLSAGRLQAYYDMFRVRMNDLKTNRPGDDWDGVFVATSK
ncbi:MAG: adenylate/guanylate cyclase domain-containing protein [Micavibrio aeruginosavorus]|uniref:Adenylate/guanylate cyclase domain-containing protein n=1 Tax=Micavibrio aeruginosavorus TaxID=349221 RepID=A0A7T5UHJ1_9BACT|nr:MAG: adenylate/guanylate cyclase domain-containing protein [Micavibrio aeruginosavorus]